MIRPRRCVVASILIFTFVTRLAAQPVEQRLDEARNLLEKDRHAAAKQLEEISAQLREAIERNPKDAASLYLLGRARFYLEDDAGAQQAFSRAAEVAPEVAEYHFMKGVALRFGGKSEAAIDALATAVKLDADNVKYAMELAQELLRAKRLADAAAIAEKVVKREPTNADALFILGLKKNESGDAQGALALYRKAAEADPDHLEAQYNVGQTYQTMNKPAESLAAFEQVVRLAPDDWRARAKVIQNLQALGRLDDVKRAREELFALRKAGKVDAKFYCREQFAEGENRVMAFEYFELTGPRAVRYSFNVQAREEGKPPLYRVSLGSYDSTNEVLRELGDIKADERLFHLDGYFPGNEHRTYGFYEEEPTYDATRKLALQVMRGELEAQSSSKVQPATRPN